MKKETTIQQKQKVVVKKCAGQKKYGIYNEQGRAITGFESYELAKFWAEQLDYEVIGCIEPIPPQDNKELFTGGEWHTELNERGKYTCVYAHPNKFICDARGRQGSISGDEYENEANAALIAQAPAMYRLLENVFQEYQKGGTISINCLAEWLSVKSKANPKQ